MSIENNIVFMLGVGRCGSYLVRGILDWHEQVLVLPIGCKFYDIWKENNFDLIIKNDPEKLKSFFNYSKLKWFSKNNAFYHKYLNKTYDFSNINWEKFVSSFRKHIKTNELTRRNVFLAVFRAYQDATGNRKAKVIIASALYSDFTEEILKDFPNARFMHIVRDPRANISSLKAIALSSYATFDFIRIIKSMTNIMRMFHKNNGFVLRCEDVILSPVPTIQNLAKWLEIDFNDSLLKLTTAGKPYTGASNFHNRQLTDFEKEPVDRWKKVLTKHEIRMIEFLFAKSMRKFGYQLLYKRNILGFLCCLLPWRGELFYNGFRKLGNKRLRHIRAFLFLPINVVKFGVSRMIFLILYLKGEYKIEQRKGENKNPQAMNNLLIKGKKIFLRTLAEKDVHGNWWKWFNDKEVTRYLNKGHEKNTPEKQMEFFRKVKNSDRDFILGICDRETEGHIGTTGIHNIREQNGKTADFGIIIGEKDFWKKGIGTEAWHLMVEHAFNNLELNFLETRIFPGNEASLKIAKKLGFKVIDVLKKDVIKDGTEIDRVLLRLDSDFWQKSVNGDA